MTNLTETINKHILDRNKALEDKCISVLEQSGLSVEEFARSYTRVEWYETDKLPCGRIAQLVYHCEIIPNDMVDAFSEQLELRLGSK